MEALKNKASGHGEPDGGFIFNGSHQTLNQVVKSRIGISQHTLRISEIIMMFIKFYNR